jgi:hypothetical protein
MKRRVALCVLLLAFTVGVSLGAWAQDDTSTSPPSSAPSQNSTQTNSTQTNSTQTSSTQTSSTQTSSTQTTPMQSNPTESNPTESTGPKPEYTQVNPARSLDFLGEAVGRSNLNLGMYVEAAYDTNLAAFSTQHLSEMSYLVGPHIGITQYRSRLGLNLSYDGGLGVYTRLANSNTYSQSFTGDIVYQLSSRWQAHGSDRYIYSANPFGAYYTIVGQPSPADPNPNLYVPFAITNQNDATLNLSDQLTQYDTITFTGDQTSRRYSNYSNSYTFLSGLYNLISYSGGANYSHQFSAQFSAGGGYTFTSLDFSHGQQRSGISSFQGFASYQLSQSLSLSGWAGPEHITAKTIIFYRGRYYTLLQADWVPAFGVSIGWQGSRQAFTTGISRQVSDGGGLLATTTAYTVNLAYRRKISARWDGIVSGMYGDNISFAASNLNKQLFPDRKYTLLQGIVQLNRQITPQLSAQLLYNYIRETQKNIYFANATGSFNDNRFSILLQYTWNHPLGQ